MKQNAVSSGSLSKKIRRTKKRILIISRNAVNQRVYKNREDATMKAIYAKLKKLESVQETMKDTLKVLKSNQEIMRDRINVLENDQDIMRDRVNIIRSNQEIMSDKINVLQIYTQSYIEESVLYRQLLNSQQCC